MARQPNAIGLNKVVFRPDSGDPVEILAGIQICDLTHECKDFDTFVRTAEDQLMDRACKEAGHGQCGADEIEGIFKCEGKYYSVKVFPAWNRYDRQYYYIDGRDRLPVCKEIDLTPQQKGAVECLWEIFGGTETDKGFKVLDQHVGLIYGDSITLQRANDILSRLRDKGFASCNVVFGVGSYTYQYNTRDTFGFAMKATWGVVNGEPRQIFKDPLTDGGSKKSAKGLLRVGQLANEFYVLDCCTPDEEASGCLEKVFEDGFLLKDVTLAEVRRTLNVA
jgi:nicotinamide phosphoribosyltransferase